MGFFKKNGAGYDIGKPIVSHGTKSSDQPYAGTRRRKDAGRGSGTPKTGEITQRRNDGSADMVSTILMWWKR